ncbi:MAG TPA: 2'-5' RNA ligase family protein [Anaerolineales bacterium]|nr:2'-5' RNA ligase family protein [Anaerolineales bacterium]
MKAAFALLANHVIHNLVRKLSWEMHQKYRTGTRHASLPPHVSLKQPFGIKDLPALEEYMAELAGSIRPLEVTLTDLQVIPVSAAGTAYGLLWIDVEETPELRNLHNRLNDELNQRFGHTPADFDGEQYQFHMTVMMGGQPVDVYRKFYSEIPDPGINLRFTARELAMFVYDEPMGPTGEYLCYKIFPIGT